MDIGGCAHALRALTRAALGRAALTVFCAKAARRKYALGRAYNGTLCCIVGKTSGTACERAHTRALHIRTQRTEARQPAKPRAHETPSASRVGLLG